MATNNPYIIDVTEENFESVVLDAPEDVTVLVDFWAPWCAPCRMMEPIFEKLASSYNGRLRIAKINTDENPILGGHFGIQGIPAVKIFRSGELVSEFTGALPEAQLCQILDRFVASETDDIASQGQKWLAEGQIAKAKHCFENAFTIDPDNLGAKLGLAQIALHESDLAKAEQLASSIEAHEKEYDAAQGILNRLGFMKACQEWGGKYACAERIDKNPDDLDARFALASCLAAEGRYQEALEEFLTIVKKNKTYKEGAVKFAMVKVFSIIGQRSPLADEYRDKLEWILY